MNDRYLYRAKRISPLELSKEKSWIEGYYSYMKPFHYIMPKGSFDSWYRINEKTLCQCTGLKDKNGKLIWENDVVEAWSQGTCARGKIYHRIDGTWIMYPAWQKGEMWYLLPNENGETTVEIAGNIFDKPELLEVGE